MPSDRIQYLLQKFFRNEYTAEEKEELALWIDTIGNEDEWKSQLEDVWNQYPVMEKMDPLKVESVLKKIFEEEKATLNFPSRKKSRINGMFRVSVMAAAVAGLLITLSIMYVNKHFRPKTIIESARQTLTKEDITPGGNKAVLLLANGKKILLDSAENGSLAQLGNTRIVKLQNGQLTYTNAGAATNPLPAEAIHFNTLRTPPGGQYQIVLPDGTKVWLNAASSIKFPTAFATNQRQVEISGEAYFEVAKNPASPFTIQIISSHGAPEANVFVLGTSFNINAYEDESAIKTTLSEGKVKVESLTNTQLAEGKQTDGTQIFPGEQVLIDKTGKLSVAKKVDLEEVTAWKNGRFDFEGNDIESVMRQIARWYNVDVKYENTISAHFMGTISRDVNLSEVLKMLEVTGTVKFKVERRTVSVF